MTEAWRSSSDSSHSPVGVPHASSELSDGELCARIRSERPNSAAGRAAFGELYARHRMCALHFALRLNRDRARAEDVVSEAFSKIWRAWGQGAGPDTAFKAYLMTAVRSESYRRTAMTRATTAVEPDVLTFIADVEPRDHATDVAERDQLGRAFTSLPLDWQSALTLIEIDGTPTADAAAAMELSPNSFSSLLRRAREGLRVAYLQEHVEPSRPECAEHSPYLARYVRRKLSPKRTEAIEAHLSHCSHCRRQSFKLRSLNTTFQAWITPAALAAALIEIDHFPTAALPVGAGTAPAGSGANTSTAATPAQPNGLAGSSKSSAGTSAAGGSGRGAVGFGDGASVLKIAIASIAATAAIAVGAVTLVRLSTEPEPQPAAAAKTSSAAASSPQPAPTRTSSPKTAPQEETAKESNGHHEGTSPDRDPTNHDDREQPSEEGGEQNPAATSAADPATTDSDGPADAGTAESTAPAPSDAPTSEGDPQPKPTDSIPDGPEPTSTTSPGAVSDPAADGARDAEANADAEASPSPEPTGPVDDAASDSDAVDPATPDGSASAEGGDGRGGDSDGGNGDDADGGSGYHCHDFGWWQQLCH